MIKEDDMSRACSIHWKDEKLIQHIGQKTWRKRPLGRPKHNWRDNIKMEMVCQYVDWIPMM